MTVNCPECKSVFRVDPAKVPATGVRARCSVCGGIIAIAAGTLPVSVTPSAASLAVPRPTPSVPASLPTPSAPAAIAPSLASAAPVSPPAAPAFAPPMRRTPAFSTPALGTAAEADRATEPPPPAVISVPPRATPTFSGIAPALGSPTRSTPAFGTPAATAVAPAAPAPSMVPTPAGSKRTINPFLRADPSQRARRLARALVSDLVAYHPAKREEGLRDGTLRQLFREEIKKSYEEYVEQVGRDVAEGAPHFQDALNEILAGGRRLF
ncbi:MAG: zinc-ribbon domain-containing protein [Gemmatimonadaceae bacterium]|nr:zinc-ribbon domain-containing protein [Gemmatimonadaceae bacterium]